MGGTFRLSSLLCLIKSFSLLKVQSKYYHFCEPSSTSPLTGRTSCSLPLCSCNTWLKPHCTVAHLTLYYSCVLLPTVLWELYKPVLFLKARKSHLCELTACLPSPSSDPQHNACNMVCIQYIYVGFNWIAS